MSSLQSVIHWSFFLHWLKEKAGVAIFVHEKLKDNVDSLGETIYDNVKYTLGIVLMSLLLEVWSSLS